MSESSPSNRATLRPVAALLLVEDVENETPEVRARRAKGSLTARAVDRTHKARIADIINIGVHQRKEKSSGEEGYEWEWARG